MIYALELTFVKNKLLNNNIFFSYYLMEIFFLFIAERRAHHMTCK